MTQTDCVKAMRVLVETGWGLMQRHTGCWVILFTPKDYAKLPLAARDYRDLERPDPVSAILWAKKWFQRLTA